MPALCARQRWRTRTCHATVLVQASGAVNGTETAIQRTVRARSPTSKANWGIVDCQQVRRKRGDRTLWYVSAFVLLTEPALANTRYILNSVNNYGGNGNLSNSHANNQGFKNYLPNWTQDIWYQDSNVYGSDFIDPQVWSGGTDDYIDRNNNFTSVYYYTGHGQESWSWDNVPNGFCNSASQCPVHAGASAKCIQRPLAHDICMYSDSNPGPFVHGASQAVVGNSPAFQTTPMRYGESPISGAWGGAGTNGGVNLMIFDMSFATTPGWEGLVSQRLFAGVRMIGFTNPIWGDTANISVRGESFAKGPQASYFTSNPMSDWASAMWLIPRTRGGTCAWWPNYDMGGGHGFNGCGCNIMIAEDNTWARASGRGSSNWFDLASDAAGSDSYGNNYWYYYSACNYDTTINRIY